MKVLLDSCIWGGAKSDLETAGYDVKWVGDFLSDPGDEAIIKLAFEEKRILVTQDKDFGELAVFRGVPHCGIIRLVDFSAAGHCSASVQILEKYSTELSQSALITAEPFKVRIRSKE